MHLGYRKKSPQRCAEEVRYLYEIGYREFLVADDIFTSDEKWATEVSENIAALNIDMLWTCTNGIRVESADERLFKTMNEAGCYRVSFGFESGNDAVLEKFGKGGKATIEKAKNAVKIARKSGIETNGFFMIGLSCDTEETMNETIEFAKTLPLDMLKFSATVAFPGTEMFNNYVKKGLIRTYEWDDYHIYNSVQLFAHENLDFSIVQQYMKRAYREAIIFNPRFIMRRLIRGLRTNEFLWDVYYFFRFISVSTTNRTKINYYARDRWKAIDFNGESPSESIYQKVRGRRETTISSV
jgi:anaerobic magnesium-protoporphyrin IX monomethyl ester cyclase